MGSRRKVKSRAPSREEEETGVSGEGTLCPPEASSWGLGGKVQPNIKERKHSALPVVARGTNCTFPLSKDYREKGAG